MRAQNWFIEDVSQERLAVRVRTEPLAVAYG